MITNRTQQHSNKKKEVYLKSKTKQELLRGLDHHNCMCVVTVNDALCILLRMEWNENKTNKKKNQKFMDV